MLPSTLKALRRRNAALAAVGATTAAAILGLAGGAAADGAPSEQHQHGTHHAGHHRAKPPVSVELFAPETGDHVGVGSKGWFIDLAADYPGGIAASGFKGEQLTGPGVHANAAPFPGAFGPGKDEDLPGLIVLDSTTQPTNPDGTPTGLAGPGQNLAGLFNLTGVTDRTATSTEIWDTWIIGAPVFGRNTASTVYVAVAADKNHNGVYDDAPATVPDANHDGRVDAKDLKAFGVASNIASARFTITD
ncbi:MAG TPA: hypothetical protein VFT50_17780 [Baekduia sp.]|nr:hypothetical protein [Baekduia sp.]